MDDASTCFRIEDCKRNITMNWKMLVVWYMASKTHSKMLAMSTIHRQLGIPPHGGDSKENPSTPKLSFNI